MFAGRLAPVALVLVGVSVGAAHGDVVFVALEIEHNQMLAERHMTKWRRSLELTTDEPD